MVVQSVRFCSRMHESVCILWQQTNQRQPVSVVVIVCNELLSVRELIERRKKTSLQEGVGRNSKETQIDSGETEFNTEFFFFFF